MDDLEIAERLLREKDFNFVAVKLGRIIYASGKKGLMAPLEGIEAKREELGGSAVADKIVGKAAALLFAYIKTSSAYAATLSSRGLKILEGYGIKVSYNRFVPHILGEEGRVCPFERAVWSIDNPEEAFLKLRSMLLSKF